MKKIVLLSKKTFDTAEQSILRCLFVLKIALFVL